MPEGLSIRLDAHEVAALADAYSRAPGIVTGHMAAAMTEASLLVERETRERTPVGAHGLLRGSIAARAPRVSGDRVEAEIGSSLSYAVPVELGTKPHRPPIEPLVDWAEARLGLGGKEARRAAWAIASKIARRGTEGAGMFAGAAEATRATVERIFRAAVTRAIEDVHAGAAS